MIETLFNEELFHAGTARRSRYSLEEIKAKFSGEALLMAATLIVYDRLLVVRNINWILKPALSGSDTLRIPLTD